MKAQRLRAPSVDGGLLAAPPLGDAPGLLRANAARLAAWDHDFQGRRAEWLRPYVRGQVVAAARGFLAGAGLDVPSGRDDDAPLVVTGHQPELFHPGVWVKNFAAATIAEHVGGQALNLIVDNDVPKGATVRVPRAEGGRLRVERVAFDDSAGEVPYEDLAVHNEALFASFGARAREALGGAIADPLLDDFWPRAVAAGAWSDRFGVRSAVARRGVEGSWGTANWEVPLSVVCETEGFAWFASHLLAQLPRFQEVHNAALVRYRALYGIRSRNHPVPALTTEGEWREAPFWVWRRSEPRRRPLLVRQKARTMDLRIKGEDAPLIELPLSAEREACCAVEQLMTLPTQGVRLRTRALTTTMFARYLLGDLFLHGIGGAKYDELGDEVSGRFFGTEPPTYLTLSQTVRLGLPDDPATPEGLKRVARTLRDLTFNPERHLPGLEGEAAGWAAAKRAAVLGPVETRAQRVERFHAIRRANEALQGLVAAERERLGAERERLERGVRRNAVAQGREFASVLHSSERLRRAFAKVRPRLADGLA